MNWLTEKLNPTIIGLFLIGLLVGGLAIGIVDTKRPTPLFSSADGGASILEDCQDEMDILVSFVGEVNGMPRPMEHNLWLSYNQQYHAFLADVVDCANNVTDAFMEEWEPEYTRLTAELQQAQEDTHIATSYAYETSREARAAYTLWQEQCDTSQQGDRVNTKDGVSVGSARNIGKQQPATTFKNDNLNSGDCDELYEEYQLAQAEAERAEAEFLQIFLEMRAIEEQIEDLNYERTNFEADRDFTYLTAYEMELRDEYDHPPLPYYSSGTDPNARAY